MLNQYSFIQEHHKAPLEAALRANSSVPAPLLASLYKQALDAVNGPAVTTETTSCSKLSDPGLGVTVGTATDKKTGAYVQLAQSGSGKPVLTFGTKWIVEMVDPGTGTTQFKHL